MKLKDLQEAAGLSPASVAKLSLHKNVSMEVLIKVCMTLSVEFGDIIEVVPDMAEKNKKELNVND